MEEDFLAGDMTDICGDLFDHIEDFLEFPIDEDLIAGVDHCPPPPPPPPQQHHDPMLPLSASSSSSSQMMMVPTPVAPAPHPLLHDVTFLGGDSSITATAPEDDDHDMAQLEWLSNFFDDSSCDPFSQDLPKDNMKMNVDTRMNSINDNSGFNGIVKSGMEDALFRTSSPVSVLEQNNNLGGLSNSGSATATAATAPTTTTSSSSSSCSGVGSSSNEKLRAPPFSPPFSPPEPMVSSIPARARTKRPRALASSRPLISLSFVPPPSSEAEAESFGESESPPSMDAATMTMMMQKNKKQKTKKKKCSPEVSAEDGSEEAEGHGAPPPPPQVRKCMHCEIQKTPQWRAGPMGPKTLCNACGVRYKSGRLFPEYRPAASPTFVPALHSNSHKKVVEMRIKTSHKTSTTAEKESPALKNCDLIEYIRRRD